VSAFELKSLPVPPAREMTAIDRLIRNNASTEEIDARLRALYDRGP
jgi:hypothetical protein